MKRALVFVDHDIIVRHFIHSGAFSELERCFDVTYVFNVDTTTSKRWLHTDVRNLGLRKVITTCIPRRRMGSWHRLYAISVLHNQRGKANYAGRLERFREIDGDLRTRFHATMAHPLIFPLARQYYLRKQGRWDPLRELIETQKPDILIHPSILAGYFVNELPAIAKRLGIPLVVLMNSWDNPSQKAVATSLPDKLVVWGNQTRGHAIEYMRMPPQDVLILGAAQFQVYRESPAEADAELRHLFGVPLGKRIVLYAGVSKGINETRHLELLDDAIEGGALPGCHILYRPHPWRGALVEGERHFFDMNFRHITMDPYMKDYYLSVAEKQDDAFHMASYQITNKLLHLVEGVISTLSTILLEGLLLGRPAIAFMPSTDMGTKYGSPTAICLRLVHFQGLWESPGMISCTEDHELAGAVRRLLDLAADPETRRAVADHARKYFVEMDGPPYAERLAALARDLTEDTPSHA
jgi:hypothetical protein